MLFKSSPVKVFVRNDSPFGEEIRISFTEEQKELNYQYVLNDEQHSESKDSFQNYQ